MVMLKISELKKLKCIHVCDVHIFCNSKKSLWFRNFNLAYKSVKSSFSTISAYTWFAWFLFEMFIQIDRVYARHNDCALIRTELIKCTKHSQIDMNRIETTSMLYPQSSL
eukprot:183967_1